MDGEWTGNTDCVPVTVEVLTFHTMNLEHPHRCSVCDPAEEFLTSKFNYLLFCNSTHKTANMWALLIANCLDESL
jgi:hypothetical protein